MGHFHWLGMLLRLYCPENSHYLEDDWNTRIYRGIQVGLVIYGKMAYGIKIFRSNGNALSTQLGSHHKHPY